MKKITLLLVLIVFLTSGISAQTTKPISILNIGMQIKKDSSKFDSLKTIIKQKEAEGKQLQQQLKEAPEKLTFILKLLGWIMSGFLVLLQIIQWLLRFSPLFEGIKNKIDNGNNLFWKRFLSETTLLMKRIQIYSASIGGAMTIALSFNLITNPLIISILGFYSGALLTIASVIYITTKDSSLQVK